MLNPYSFYYLWQDPLGRKYINDLINFYINNNETYQLLDFFNKSFNDVRSYVLFESISKIVLIDFNLKNRCINDDLAIIDILESTSSKKIYFILLTNIKGKNSFNNNIIYIFKDNTFLFADSYDNQYKVNKILTKYLYTINDTYIKLYNHELKLLKSIDN